MPRSYFDPRQVGVKMSKNKLLYTKRANKRGHLRYGGLLTIIVKLSEGRKPVHEEWGNKPFMAQMRSGHIGVFVREDRGKLPIQQVWGLGVGGLFDTKAVMDATKAIINDKFLSRFMYWLEYFNNKAR